MKGPRTFVALALVIAWTPPQPSRGDAFTVTEWFLGTSPGPATGTIVNPLHLVQEGSLGGTSAQSIFNFAWDESAGTGDFLIEGEHVAESTGEVGVVKASSSGQIFCDVSQDLIVDIEASYSYILPTDGMTVTLWMAIGDFEKGESLYSEFKSKSSFPVWPVSGTLSFATQILMPAGHEWLLAYNMDARAGTFAPAGALASGSGLVKWEFSPIPDPATATLLLPALMLLPRRRGFAGRAMRGSS